MMDHKILFKQIAEKDFELLHAKKNLKETKEKIRVEQERCEHIAEVTKLVQDTCQNIQNSVHKKIADIVNRCLEVVFDDPYEFRIVFEKKRNKTEARLVFARDEEEIDPYTAAGGGVIDIVSFALRLACLCMQKPKRRSVLILDEPFRFVSRKLLVRVNQMIHSLSQEMDMQFVIITHTEELRGQKHIVIE